MGALNLNRRYVPILICSMVMHVAGAPPETIGIPILPAKTDGKTREGKLMQAHTASKLLSQLTGGAVTNTNPKELSHLISRLNQHEGRLDPVMTDVFSALDRTYRDTTAVAARESSTELFPDEAASNRVASSTEENGVIWQDNMHRPFKRNRNANKFSSKYRSNNEYPSVSHSGTKKNASMDNVESNKDSIPFNHVNDPNLRNHRLYDWEFETYKNFTHIDQPEDLMAEEDIATETKVSPVTATPPSNYSVKQHTQEKKPHDSHREAVTFVERGKAAKSKRVKVKGIPHIVISLEDTSENGFANGPETYKVHLPLDSGEQSLHQRPREPLRHSSNENIVYVHGDSGEVDRYPYATMRDPTRSGSDDRNTAPRGHQFFRPSAADLSDAVFLDPDEDFFTSTVRNTSPHVLTDQEMSSETLPKRRRKKLKKITRKEEIEGLAQASNRFNNRLGDMDEGHPNLQFSPMYSNPMNEEGGRAHLGNTPRTPIPRLPLMKPTQYPGLVESNRMKSDRVLNAGESTDEYGMPTQGQPMNPANFEHFDPSMHHHDGNIGNYYSLHTDPSMQPSLGPATEHSAPYGQKNNYDLTSTEYLGNGNRFQNALNALNIFNNQRPAKKLQAAMTDQIIAPGNVEDFYHPYAASDHQVNQYYEDSYPSSWSNTWFILAGLIIFTAMFAFMLPLFLQPGRMGKKDHRHDLDEDDLLSDNFAGSGSNNNYVFDNTNNDANQNSDLWSEIKGVYNDLVSMVRGDYSILQKLKKVPEHEQGPKIVYREDEHELEDENSDSDEEDDEKTDNRVNVRNRKRERFMKKQQQMLKKKQQQEMKRQQQQEQQQTPVTQAKAHHSAFGKKTLLSKIKAEVGRDNKDDGKTIEASSVNNLVVFSGPGGPMGRQLDEEEPSARSVTGFVLPNNDTMATMAPMMFVNMTGYPSAADSFLREWAQVQLINNQ